jgi:hypothetical protein
VRGEPETRKPETPKMSLRDLTLELDPGLRAALEEVARLEWTLESIQAQKRQNAMAAVLRDGRSLEGLGACERRVDAFAYHDWGLKEGYACWQDKGFKRYFDRIAPECRVKSRGTKVQVGYTAARRFVVPVHDRQEPRFRKSYPATGLEPAPSPLGGERAGVRGAVPELPNPELLTQ